MDDIGVQTHGVVAVVNVQVAELIASPQLFLATTLQLYVVFAIKTGLIVQELVVTVAVTEAGTLPTPK